MQLYTKNNCPACEKVKEYIKTREFDTPIEIINISEIADKQSVLEYLFKYSQTFPTLITHEYFVSKSEDIINHLKSIK